MSGWGTRARAQFLLLVCCGLLGGCVVDHQYGRSVRYNIEAENAQQQALLLNIIRASLRRPMQFTTLTNLDGDLSVKASASWGIPFGRYVGSNANMLTINAPDYTENAFVKVATLDDSSYYRGLLSPVSPQLFDLFIHSGYPLEILMNLFVRNIVVQRQDGVCAGGSHIRGCEFTFSNFASSDSEIDLFQRLVSYFLRLGLTTEHIEKVAGKKSAKAKKKDDDDEPPDSDDENGYMLCFAPSNPRDERLAQSSLCGGALTKAEGAANVGQLRKRPNIGKTSTLMVELEPALISDLQAIAEVDNRSDLPAELSLFSGRRVAVVVYTRSIQNIIYYLGELVRRQNDPEFGKSQRIIQVLAVPRHPFRDDPVPRDSRRCIDVPAKYPCRYLFQVREDLLPGAPALSTSYEGKQYTIVDDRNENGTSTQVFDLAKQLFAIKIKADKLPRTTTISVNR